MSRLLFNINFCGTNMEATRKNLASIEAIKQFDDCILISGVGAPDGYDETTQEHYPTPGTYYVDQNLKRQMKYPWFNQHFSYVQRLAGIAWGEGEKDNLAFAMQHVDKKMQAVAADEAVHINISGFSRGAAAAIHFANKISRQYGSRIKLNIFLVDPNAGLGRQNYQLKKHIPMNVDNIYIVFNRLEKISLLQSLRLSHYLFTSPKTSVATLYVQGDHLEQEQLPTDDPIRLNAATTNQQLLELFYESYGAVRVKPKGQFFQANAFVHKGFVSHKVKESALDQAIRSIQPIMDKYQSQRTLNNNTYLERFNSEIGVLNHPHYSELGYYFMHLLSEIDREEYKTRAEQERAACLLQVTNRLIRAMTPGECFSKNQKQQALDEFKKCTRENQYNEIILQISAHIVGLVIGIFLGLAIATSGFVVGLMRWETLGLASIPYAALGASNGFFSGFTWGKTQVLGHQNERKIDGVIQKIFKADDEEVRTIYAKSF